MRKPVGDCPTEQISPAAGREADEQPQLLALIKWALRRRTIGREGNCCDEGHRGELSDHACFLRMPLLRHCPSPEPYPILVRAVAPPARLTSEIEMKDAPRNSVNSWQRMA